MWCRRASAVLFGLMVTLAHAADSKAPGPHKQLRYLMGTLVEIEAYPPDATAAAADKTDDGINAAFEELKRLDAQLSNWRADSELMLLNRSGAQPGTSIPVSPELFARLAKAFAIAERTDGAFDPTVGPLVRAWGFLPSNAESGPQTLAEARGRVGWRKVTLDPGSHTVRFGAPQMEIDLGGIAKGYAAQRAVDILATRGITRAFVSLGESSIVTSGQPRSIFIRDPGNPSQPVAKVELIAGVGLATSGTYEKTVKTAAGRKSHILDPRTGEAVGGAVGVTVLAEDAETADALTKPFFFVDSLRSPEAQKILRNFPKASVMLIARRGDSLRVETAGAEPQRFISLLSPKGSASPHVAKTR